MAEAKSKAKDAPGQLMLFVEPVAKPARHWASAPRKADYTGKRVGRWTVMEYAGCLTLEGTKWRDCYYRCQCDCGTVALVRTSTLSGDPDKNGRSCGCLKRDLAKEGVASRRRKLEGLRFGRLVVVRHAGEHPRLYRPYFLCRCDCGQETTVSGQSLEQGATKSCGCWKIEEFVARNRRHNACKSPEYKAWLGMKARCHNSLFYVRRGITVCERWAASFEAFVADMGVKPAPDYSLDRIDNGRGYEPGNCRWVTPDVQSKNKSNNRRLTVQGRTMLLSEWAEEMGLSVATIYVRLAKGMTEEEAVLTPNLSIRRTDLKPPSAI